MVFIGTTSLVGATTATGLITANGSIATNTISLLYTTAPTLVAGQIGFIYNGTGSGLITTTLTTYATISNLPIGVYLLNGIEDNGGGAANIQIKLRIVAGATTLATFTGTSLTGVSLGGTSGVFFHNNTVVQNITLNATSSANCTASSNIKLQAIRIA